MAAGEDGHEQLLDDLFLPDDDLGDLGAEPAVQFAHGVDRRDIGIGDGRGGWSGGGRVRHRWQVNFARTVMAVIRRAKEFCRAGALCIRLASGVWAAHGSAADA